MVLMPKPVRKRRTEISVGRKKGKRKKRGKTFHASMQKEITVPDIDNPGRETATIRWQPQFVKKYTYHHDWEQEGRKFLGRRRRRKTPRWEVSGEAS